MTKNSVLKRLRRFDQSWISLVLVFFAIVYLFPILWVILSSFKDGSELFRWPPTLLPEDPTVQNYVQAFEKGDFGRFFLNSGLVTIAATILTIIINTMAGYAFAKYRFKGDTFLFLFFISTLMLPLEVLMIPIFQVIKVFGMYNSFWGLIIPPAATPTGVFLLRQYFLTVPKDLMEAARIDGASAPKIFLKLMLPIGDGTTTYGLCWSFATPKSTRCSWHWQTSPASTPWTGTACWRCRWSP